MSDITSDLPIIKQDRNRSASDMETSNASTLVTLDDSISNGKMGLAEDGASFLIDLLSDLSSEPGRYAAREAFSNAVDAVNERIKQESAAGNTDYAPLIEATIWASDDSFDSSTIAYKLSHADGLDEKIGAGTFELIDNGVGMSRETVERCFLTYLGSSKRGDASQIGSKGLGSKSYITCCESYTVITTRDGKETIATVTRGNGENPYTIETHDTTRDNGTKITFIVRTGLILEQMRKCLDEIASFSPVPFKLNGVMNECMLADSPYCRGNRVDSTIMPLGRVECGKSPDGKPVSFRMWCQIDTLPKLCDVNAAGSLLIVLVLGGYPYVLSSQPKPYSSFSRYSSNKVYVEGAPDYLDFTPSRDEIKKNDVSVAFDKAVRNALSKLNPMRYVMEAVKLCTSVTDAYRVMSVTNSIIAIRDDGTLHMTYRKAPNVWFDSYDDGFACDNGYDMTDTNRPSRMLLSNANAWIVKCAIDNGIDNDPRLCCSTISLLTRHCVDSWHFPNGDDAFRFIRIGIEVPRSSVSIVSWVSSKGTYATAASEYTIKKSELLDIMNDGTTMLTAPNAVCSAVLSLSDVLIVCDADDMTLKTLKNNPRAMYRLTGKTANTGAVAIVTSLSVDNATVKAIAASINQSTSKRAGAINTNTSIAHRCTVVTVDDVVAKAREIRRMRASLSPNPRKSINVELAKKALCHVIPIDSGNPFNLDWWNGSVSDGMTGVLRYDEQDWNEEIDIAPSDTDMIGDTLLVTGIRAGQARNWSKSNLAASMQSLAAVMQRCGKIGKKFKRIAFLPESTTATRVNTFENMGWTFLLDARRGSVKRKNGLLPAGAVKFHHVHDMLRTVDTVDELVKTKFDGDDIVAFVDTINLPDLKLDSDERIVAAAMCMTWGNDPYGTDRKWKTQAYSSAAIGDVKTAFDSIGVTVDSSVAKAIELGIKAIGKRPTVSCVMPFGFINHYSIQPFIREKQKDDDAFSNQIANARRFLSKLDSLLDAVNEKNNLQFDTYSCDIPDAALRMMRTGFTQAVVKEIIDDGKLDTLIKMSQDI